jgi:preprotein translocase subunit SecE
VTDTRGATATPERGRSGGSGGRASLPARLSLFYRQVVAELRKVVWPTRKELITYTSVVIVFVLVVIAYISGLDLVFSQAAFWVFG